MFYLKLAFQNIRKSLSNFSPFLLATTVMFAITLILSNLAFSKSLDQLKGADAVRMLMKLGLAIIILFSVIIVSYSYRFLLKQRTREFGLYNILGLNKLNIATISFWELLMTFIMTLVAGTIFGLVFSEFLFLIFVRLIGGNYFNLTVSIPAVLLTILVFAAIFALLMFFAMVTIKRNSAISLLKDNTRSEKEPRGRLIMSVISLIMLSVAYYLALSVQGPIEALMKFFIAVVLVIIGTYLLYIGVTIFVLKRQKANKNYYYKPEHFITTSSMLYRMKTNAVGLANITILVTMTFVTLATSVALYVGVQKVVADQFPKNTNISISGKNIDENKAALNAFTQENGVDTSKTVPYSSFTVMTNFSVNANQEAVLPAQSAKMNDYAALRFVTRDDMVKLGNDLPELAPHQVILYKAFGDKAVKLVDWYGEKLEIVKEVPSLKNLPKFPGVFDVFVFVVSDGQELAKVNDLNNQEELKKNPGAVEFTTPISTDLLVNLPAKQGEALVKKAANVNNQPNQVGVATEKESKSAIMEFTGGFLFIGFMLGITFILGAALIIYYKQISEGAEDKRSYRILQEVGLTKKEVKKSIDSQVMVVFFMPIIVSIIHFAAAFVMISKLINIFGITDIGMIATVSGITILVISVIYYLIYRKTSKIYYRIVER
ncbi:MAG: ABC transporter permease [Lactococcus sp.]|jgi:putative ABC transport system permease protein